MPYNITNFLFTIKIILQSKMEFNLFFTSFSYDCFIHISVILRYPEWVM